MSRQRQALDPFFILILFGTLAIPHFAERLTPPSQHVYYRGAAAIIALLMWWNVRTDVSASTSKGQEQGSKMIRAGWLLMAATQSLAALRLIT